MTTKRLGTIVYTLLATVALSVLPGLPSDAKTSIKDEITIGKKAAVDIEKEFPLSENKVWQGEIDKLGKSLLPYVKRKDLAYTFKILNEKVNGKNQVDAFSLPGGPIYFSERMWQLLTKDERLGVLGHEIAHVDKRHAIDTMSEAQKRSIWATAVLILAGAKNNWWDAADLANSLYTLKYSRKRETEADYMGLELVRQAGGNPAGLVTAMKKIMRMEQENGGGTVKVLSTHPLTKDRIEYMTKRCLEMGLKPSDMEIKFTDQPDRLGNVTSLDKKAKLVSVSTVRNLGNSEVIWIKKPLWDDKAEAIRPMPVAKGKVIAPGNKAQISVTMEPGFEFTDIEQGDGIYPQ